MTTTDTNNSDITKIIDKVKKLLSLSKNNTNENEMRAATAAADKLLQEYRLTMAQVEAQAEIVNDPMTRRTVSEGGRRTAWRESLLAHLIEHYGCAWYMSSYRNGGKYGKGIQSYTIVGRESDVAIVQYMFSYLEGEVQRICKSTNKGLGIRYALSWMLGCAQGIGAQLAQLRTAMKQEAAEQNNSAAIVLLSKRGEEANNFMRSDGTKFRTAAPISGASDWGARSSGYEEGKKMELRAGLNSGGEGAARLGG